MKVEDIVKLLSANTKYKLLGGRTGKTLYKSWANKNLDKYKDLEVCFEPIMADSYIQSNFINGVVEHIEPIISIYVSGL